ncbi:lytic transglycosylase domain-containing protein [Fusobacterium sp. SYSU M8A802]
MKKLLILILINLAFKAYANDKLKEYYLQKIVDPNVAITAYNDVNRFSKEFNVDENLITAIIQAESNFVPNIKSQKGAIGFMQIMPGTAELLNIDPNDPTQNIYGGIKYFKNLLNNNNNNIPLALAAYNAGMGNLIKYDSIPPFPETQAYIEKVLNTYNLISGNEKIFYSNEFNNNSFEWGENEDSDTK